MPCQLLDGFSLLVQLFLALGSFSSLVYKRHCERPQRKLRIWLFDTSKQALSAGLVHLLNMAIAQVVGARAEPRAKSRDPCVVYTVNLCFDVAVGTLISYHLLLVAERALSRLAECGCCGAPSLAACARACASTGQYGCPPRVSRWLPQLALWVLIVCVSKALCAAIALRTRLVMDLGAMLLRPLAPSPRAELVIVMLVLPLVLSVAQLWVQDNFLKLDTAKRTQGAGATYAPLYRCPVVEMHGTVDGEPIDALPHAHLCGLGLQAVRAPSGDVLALAQPPTPATWAEGDALAVSRSSSLATRALDVDEDAAAGAQPQPSPGPALGDGGPALHNPHGQG